MVQNLTVTANNDSQEAIAFNPLEMLAATRQLSKLMAAEIALLKDMKLARIHELYEEKIALATKLEGYREALKNNPELLQSIPKRTLDEMKNESVNFDKLAQEDAEQIKKAQEVHKLVMNALKKTLEKNVVMRSGYNGKGVIDVGYSAGNVAQPVSVYEEI